MAVAVPSGMQKGAAAASTAVVVVAATAAADTAKINVSLRL